MRRTLKHYLKLAEPSRVLKLASIAILGSALTVFSLSASALADVAVSGGEATGQGGDGTMSAVARAAMMRGALPASAADIAAKAAANRASDAARGAIATDASGPAGGGTGARLPVIVSPIAGQLDVGSTPPDTTGATGTTRYVQLVNRRFMIVNRATNATLSSGTLNQLAGFASTVNSFDPQIIWDPTTNRFYYTMDSVISSVDNRLAFGFSKTASPNTAADWCKYFVNYGSIFPDYPKLGDNRYFLLIGVNDFAPSFLRSDIVALPKPLGTGAIPVCPTFTALMNGRGLIFTNLKDTGGVQTFTPVPSNAADTNNFGYAVARNLFLPSTRLWVYPINGPAVGLPTISPARLVTVPSYTVPPDAGQPVLTQKLDTLDARPTQAILSRNPLRAGSPLSLWTQHTVANGTASMVRWYEIRPDVPAPIVQRTGVISGAGTFFFNGAISSDRRVDGATIANGGSFVIAYNVTRVSPAINARIVMGSSLLGAPLTFTTVKNSVGPYRDFACAGVGQTCRWGDYAGATPDPRPIGSTRAVGLTSQYNSGGTATTQSNWRTWIWHARP